MQMVFQKINWKLIMNWFDDLQQIMVDEKDALSKNWSHESKNVAVYAIQGKRSRMEDRYVVNTNINDTGVSLFAIFDGHAGEVS